MRESKKKSINLKMATNDKVICEKCKKNLNLRSGKPIVCDGDCKLTFHMVCAGISTKKYDEYISDSTAYWFCDVCKSTRKKRISILIDGTSTKSPSAASSKTPTNATSDVRKNTNNSSKNDRVCLDDIYKLLQDLQKTVSAIQTDLSTHKDIIKQLTDQNISLRNENDELKHCVNNIESQIDDMKQRKILNNILICGVPTVDNENLGEVVNKIGNAIGYKVEPDDIINIHRKALPANSNSGLPPPIVVQFANSAAKSEMMAANKSKKLDSLIFLAEHVHPKRPIYLNEQLTRHKQFMFKEARQLKREGRIKYAWTRNGEIYVRKSEETPHVRFKNINQCHDF